MRVMSPIKRDNKFVRGQSRNLQLPVIDTQNTLQHCLQLEYCCDRCLQYHRTTTLRTVQAANAMIQTLEWGLDDSLTAPHRFGAIH